MTLRKVGATMMNENVKKAYEELIVNRNMLRNAKEKATDGEAILGLYNSAKPLLEEEQYAVFAKSLQQHVLSYHRGETDKDFVLEYASKLVEMIEERNKSAYSEEINQIYEDTKNAFEEVSSMVQAGLDLTKERVKEEGPKYVDTAEKRAKKMARKLVQGFNKWLNEDNEEENAGSEDE